MAALGSIFFKRTLKKFLECEDLTSAKGIELTAKIREAASGSLSKILETIPSVQNPHRDALVNICVEGGLQEELLDSLENDATLIRRSAAQVLSNTPKVNPAKLYKRLHETDVSKTEIIEILGFQKKLLKPEQIISNAIKLDKVHAEQLMKLINGSEVPLELNAVSIEPSKITNDNLKIILLRYLAGLQHRDVAVVIGKFLADKNKTIAMEALKSLRKLKVDFDASLLLRNIEGMSEIERDIALEIISEQASPELVPKLAPWTAGKSEEIREALIKIVIKHISPENLELFLQRLNEQEWWGKDQAIKSLQKLGTNQLFSAAQDLTNHKDEFVRDTAQQLAAQQGGMTDINKVGETAVHDAWQVREKAIRALGNSGKRESLKPLKQSLDKWPESATAVLKAVGQLGFSKGLEIAFLCLRMSEALIQREALETIALLTTQKHADTVRSYIIKRVPFLQATVKDTAEEVVNKLTSDFGLSELNINREEFFDTRLVKPEQTPTGETSTGGVSVEAVKPLSLEELKEGDTWMDRYRIKKEVGRGAMGRVMLAEDEMVGEELILKFMHPELTADRDSMERFSREVKYSRKISHNNVIRVHDLLSMDGLSAISMEYFESHGIDEILRKEKSFDVKTGLEILYQVSEGMVAAHNQEVVHRDLKPSNILMDNTGLVKVVDFGIASVSSNADATLTQVGSIIGTPAYLSPERASGMEASILCDIYALGVIAYLMFTGDLPYKGETVSILFQHIAGKAPPIRELDSSINPEVSLFVNNLMAAEAKNRIQSMQDVGRSIKTLLQKL